MNTIKIGIVGLGQFAPQFIRLFKAHPGVSEVYICDVVPDRVELVGNEFGLERRYSDFSELLASDVDAVAIFTQRWLHGPMSIEALSAGKSVYSAVPMGVSVDEISTIVDLVKETGLTYMMGETSYYLPATVLCRDQWNRGTFGHFVHAEGAYVHDMSHGFYDAYKFSGGADWKKTASVPPMLYPTHSLGAVLGVTSSYATSVSCVGFVDREGDGVFEKDVSLWGNDFSNESALFATADGGSVRVNEFRRVGVPSARNEVILSLFGTKGSFEQQTGSAILQTLDDFTDVQDQILTETSSAFVGAAGQGSDALQRVSEKLRESFESGFAPVHDLIREQLPAEFDGLPNGHEGSHQFLVDDFVTACVRGSLPPVNAWVAARYTIPGLIAHESAVRGGERLDVPDLGPAPADR